MKGKKTLGITITIASIFLVAVVCFAAYHHMGEIDSGIFLSVYPDKAGTKLDSCNLCHTGGTFNGTKYGNCQYCHAVTNYGTSGNYYDTLNPYGKDYYAQGRNSVAITAIENLDSDGDGYSNKAEIAAGRYPGDSLDDPTKIAAPSKIYTRDQLEKMPQHTQFLLMDASKSTDTYVEYSGVSMEKLLKRIALPSAISARVLSPDGFYADHPFQYDPKLNVYNVYGTYPAANFYYNAQADIAMYPYPPSDKKNLGWCDYSAPSVSRRNHGDPINNPQGLKMLLAIKRDGEYLTPGVLNLQNKLDGEGPFRVVPPQKIPGPPEQRSTAANAQDPSVWIWPYNPNGDHNAGSSTRATTMIRVEPLPVGTTDIDLLEAGWPYIDADIPKIVVYGAIDPVPNILEKLVQLHEAIDAAPKSAFKQPFANKLALKLKIDVVWWLVKTGHYDKALQKLDNDILQKMNGCSQPSGAPDKNDWVKDCEIQKQFYWLTNEIMVLMRIVA
jgi:hypothetical protein